MRVDGTVRRLVLAALLLSPVAAFAQAAPVTVSDGRLRMLLPSRPAAGYFTATNRGDAALVLTGASSPACGSLMLHRSVSSGGMESMMDVARVDLPARGSIAFSPGGYHLMCMQPSATLRPGQSVPVTLRFAGGAVANGSLAVVGAR